MANIVDEVRKELNSFESSELERILQAVESQELYYSGLHNISGGYATAEAYDIEEIDDYEEETEEWVEVIHLEITSGEAGVGYNSSFQTTGTIPRKIVGDLKMPLKEKLKQIQGDS